MNSKRSTFAMALALLPWQVHAHPFHWSAESINFFGGLFHPLGSLEHVLTMFLVGYSFSRFGKMASLALSSFFIALMMLGVVLSQMGIEVPGAEAMVSMSVLTLICMTVLQRQRLLWCLLVSAVFAMLHGYQHAYDIWLDDKAIDYTAGFAVATLILLAAGTLTGNMIYWLIKNIHSATSPKGYHWTGVLNNPMYPAKHKE